jgi:hypothetical protein
MMKLRKKLFEKRSDLLNPKNDYPIRISRKYTVQGVTPTAWTFSPPYNIL